MLDWQVIEVAITSSLVTLIWLIQLMHYPSFRYVEPAEFKAFHQHHSFSISLVVIPLMLAEVALSLYFLSQGAPASVWAGLCVLVAWGSTFLLQVPEHTKLAEGFAITAINRLIHTNWLRTFAWTAKLILLVVFYSSR